MINGGANNQLNISDSHFNALLNSASYYTRSQLEFYNKFNRFGYYDQYNIFPHTKEYIFITKPDLHIYESGNPTILNTEIKSIPYFQECLRLFPEVLRELQISHSGNPSPFMNILTNRVTNSIDLPSLTKLDMENSSNIYGDNITYQWSSSTSDINHDFSLDFKETKGLEIYRMLKAWDLYERKKAEGSITPPNDDYVLNKILHDQCAAYKLIVGEDGETLLYYAKLWGVYPKTLARDVFSNPMNGELEFSVNFNAEFVDDMEPTIISSFNELVRPYLSGEDIPIYNTSTRSVDGRWARMPYIEFDPRSTLDFKHGRYILKWRG